MLSIESLGRTSGVVEPTHLSHVLWGSKSISPGLWSELCSTGAAGVSQALPDRRGARGVFVWGVPAVDWISSLPDVSGFATFRDDHVAEQEMSVVFPGPLR